MYILRHQNMILVHVRTEAVAVIHLKDGISERITMLSVTSAVTNWSTWWEGKMMQTGLGVWRLYTVETFFCDIYSRGEIKCYFSFPYSFHPTVFHSPLTIQEKKKKWKKGDDPPASFFSRSSLWIGLNIFSSRILAFNDIQIVWSLAY